MGKSRYNFFDDIFNYETNKIQKGFMKEGAMDIFKSSDNILFEIPVEYNLRPDLIANKFFNNPKLYWILVYINDINDSPEGFYTGRTIEIPRYEKIMEFI